MIPVPVLHQLILGSVAICWLALILGWITHSDWRRNFLTKKRRPRC